jgi:hypothetical protein
VDEEVANLASRVLMTGAIQSIPLNASAQSNDGIHCRVIWNRRVVATQRVRLPNGQYRIKISPNFRTFIQPQTPQVDEAADE